MRVFLCRILDFLLTTRRFCVIILIDCKFLHIREELVMNNNNSGFKGFLLSGAGKAVMIAVFYILIFGIIMLFVQTDSAYLALIFMVIFAYFGWKSLDKIQPDIFLILPIIGWIIFFVIKFVLSLVIGIFVAPFQISNKIVEVIQNSIS